MATSYKENCCKDYCLDCKKLSYAGRVQLVQVVLFGIQSYWAQLFPLPSKVLKTIEAYCRSYVWTGANTISKKALIAWDKICAPKAAGGLNLINMDLWNKAAIAKNYWDLAQKEDKLQLNSRNIRVNIFFNQLPLP
uniref:Reverse transcriptase n=1 Tax=Solanum tuberosum TaxID=4113 RepID=M1A0M8_SOLTU